MKKFFFIFFGLAFSVLFVASAHALTVSPIVIDFSVDPGSAQEQTLTLNNEEQRSLRVVPTLLQVTSTDQNGFPQFALAPSDSFIAKHISFPQGTEYVLGPGEKVEIPVRVSVPDDTKSGGRYAVISWGAQELVSGIALSGQPGVNMAIDVTGEVEESGEIARFEPSASWTLDLPVFFEADIRNTGGRHSVVKGAVTIRNIFGAIVATLPLTARIDNNNREPIRVLPDTTRTVYTMWERGFALGPYTAELHVDAGPAGQYSATASFVIISRLAIGAGLGILILTLLFLLLKTLRSGVK
ncbi:MAG: hypothetical protein AAB855_03885 [Patescibacteria group bacterium]